MRSAPEADGAAPLSSIPAACASACPEPCASCDARRVSLCRVVPDERLHRLAERLSVRRFAPGETLAFDGDPATFVLNITQGSVKVFRSMADGRRSVTGFLFAGDFLGLVSGETFSFGAEALEPVVVCRFLKADFRRLLKEMPDLEAELLDRVSHELEAAQDQMLLLSRKTALERVATFILRLAERSAASGVAADVARFPMTRADIADYLGLTTETVSRTLTRLKVTGVIRLIEGNAARVLRPDRLAQLASADTPQAQGRQTPAVQSGGLRA